MKKLQEVKNKMTNSISAKIIIISIIGLLMLIPAGMIQGLIKDRQQLRDEVVDEISDKWGMSQVITGPVLTIPYYEYVQDEDKLQKVTRFLYILPETLDIDGVVNSEIRYRGIYKVVVYNADTKINGNFTIPSAKDLKIEPENIDWSNAFITVGIPDMRGIQNEILINWEGEKFHVEPGTRVTFIRSGISSDIAINENKKDYHFQFDLLLNGSRHLYFTPVGKITNVHLTSAWNNPGFTGSYLPDHRKVTKAGFDADWQVLHLNRNYPQVWKNKIYTLSTSSFGIDLLLPVDEYQKSYRSTKYAIMFIGLTFVIFLFVEIINKKRVHPVQYMLVSAALLIFYTLLLSLSEQIGFNLAYLISGIAIVGLISYYAFLVFRSVKLTVIVGSAITLLYVFLFTILQLQDYALLFGSIGLFLVLAIIMYLSRKIDWYQNEENSTLTEQHQTTI